MYTRSRCKNITETIHTHTHTKTIMTQTGQRDSGSHAPEHRRLAIAVYIIEIVISTHLINCALATRPACSFVSRAHVWVCVAIRHQPTHTMHNGVWGAAAAAAGYGIQNCIPHSFARAYMTPPGEATPHTEHGTHKRAD